MMARYGDFASSLRDECRVCYTATTYAIVSLLIRMIDAAAAYFR